MLRNKIRELTQQYLPEFKAIRQHIHAHPELSFEEYNTAEYVSQRLTEFGIEHTKGVAGTGLVGIIKGKNPESRVIALRAELDALPIKEENDVPYKSQNEGVMHACGHDVHTTCLLGTAKLLDLLKDEWEGTIKLIFQPGEEKDPGGASLMIKAGALENPMPEAILALHVYPHLPAGTIGYRSGLYMASSDEIKIIVKGKGGHAALPHQTIDPITIAAQLITSLQNIISRNKNPLSYSVLSICKIAGGFTTNVIPDEVEILGTLRCMDEAWRFKAHELIKTQTELLCQSMGGSAEVHIPVGYPCLYNNPELTDKVVELAKEFIGNDHVKELDLRMAAEDFSFYTHHVPGCFYRIGTNLNNEQFTYPVHNSRFDIHEDAIGTGVSMMTWLATQVNMK